MTQVPVQPQKVSPFTTDIVPSISATSLNPNPPVPEGLELSIGERTGISLRRQLLTTVLPLTLAPLGVASVVGYLISQNQNQIRLDQALQGQALLVNEGIRQSMENEFKVTSNLAANPLVLEKVRRGGRQAEAEDLMLSRRTVNDIEDRFAKTKLLQPDQAFNRYLARVAETEGFDEVIITEQNGLNVGYTNITDDFVQIDDQWWQGAKAQKQWISNPTYDSSSESGFGLNLSQSILDPSSGRFLGVVKVFFPAVRFGNLAEYLKNAGIQGSQEVQLLDVSLGSVLLAYTEKGEKVPAGPLDRLNVNGGSVISKIATRLAEVNRANPRPAPDQLQQELQSSFPVQNVQVSIAQSVDNEEVIAENLIASFIYQGRQYALSPLPVLDWVAIASMETSEIRAQSQGLLNVFGLLALVLGGVAATITLGFSRQLTSPLDELSNTAREVSQGNLDVTAVPQGSLETQTLANTFNELVVRVKGFLQEQAMNARQATLAAEITGARVARLEELPPILDKVVNEAREILQTERVVVYQFNDDWSGAIVAESVIANLPSALEQQLGDPCIPQETRDRYVADGILLINDVSLAQLHPEHMALLQNLKVKSILGVPVLSQGKLYGLLITHYCQKTHQWQPSEVEFLKQIGRQVGLVVERVKLLEQTQYLAEEQRQLKEGLQRNALQLLIDVDPVSQGDLTVRARVTEDEIGTVADSYNATIASLRKIVGQVQEAARQVNDTTGTSDRYIQSLSTAAAQQVQEILTALERVQEMSQSVRLVAANAEKAEAAVQEAAQTVQEGDAAMNRTVDGILAIRTTVAETAKKVKRLGESSQKISNVVNLISGFAAQTNMLALNAAIEASRAGEDGKGFAVVAEEVRELARQSSEATTEIEKLVASIQAETNEVVRAMEAGTEQVVMGTQLVDDTRQSLNKITATSRQISDLVASISQATEVQAQASETVAEAMNSVTAIANQNAEATDQVSESFDQLRAVAQTLQSEVGRFKVS
jgi:methyl-accepting chemotaxis protein PixJ